MGVLETYSRITPFLWFDRNAEEAVDFYVGIFANSKKLEVLKSPNDAAAPKGSVLTVGFELDGLQFTALNGGPHFKFNEAVSFTVRCDSQQEVDYYWEKLLAGGGKEMDCGWLKDKFGLCWQIVPAKLPGMLKNPKVMEKMMTMQKFNIAELEAADRE